MAGTRLLISSLATFTLISAIIISLHVGFCPHHDKDHHSRRTAVSDDDDDVGNGVRKPAPFRSANILGVSPKSLIPPLPYDTDDTQNEDDVTGIFQSINPLLCPWTLISTVLLTDSNVSSEGSNVQSVLKSQPASTTCAKTGTNSNQYSDSELEYPHLDLRVKFVVEDVIENQNKMQSVGDGVGLVDDDVDQVQGGGSNVKQGSAIELHHSLREKIFTVVKDMALNLPSYINGLEQVSISFTDTPIDVLAVDEPILQPSVVSKNRKTAHGHSSSNFSRLPTNDEIKKIWNYVVHDERTDGSVNKKNNDLDDGQSTSALLVVYLPSIRNFAPSFSSQYSQEQQNSSDIDSDDGIKEKDDAGDSIQNHQQEKSLVSPIVWSFKVKENTSSTVPDTESGISRRLVSSRILIPSIEYTGDRNLGLSPDNEDVELVMMEKIEFHFERWLAESIMSFFGTHEIKTGSSSVEIWKLLHRLWTEQTMDSYHSIDNTTRKENLSLTHPILLEDIGDEELDTETCQAKIVDLQIAYESIELDQSVKRRRRERGRYQSPQGGTPQQQQKLLFVPDFPIEHYAAILLPLIFPLLLPLLISTIKEYKRLKTKRKEKQEDALSPKKEEEEEEPVADINSNIAPHQTPVQAS